MATHSSILAWRIPQTEDPTGWRATVRGVAESDTAEVTEHSHVCASIFRWARDTSNYS